MADVQRYSTFCERREKYRRILEGLTLMSDILVRNVLKQAACAEYILQVIMGDQTLRVLECVVQKDYKNLQGRSAVLDCVIRDTRGKLFDLEIQQESEGASPRRTRYHSGLLDMNTLEAGQDFEELPESCVIFITRDDALGYDLPICHIQKQVCEKDAAFDDGAYVIYVNSRVQDDTELGRLMHDMHCSHADEMYSEILAARMRELKETQEGVDAMCREMDALYQEGIEFGEERGIERGKKEMVQSLFAMGIPLDKIAQAAKESVSCVRQWIAEGTAATK